MGGQGSGADCTKQTAQVHVQLTGWMQVGQDQQTGVGGILCNVGFSVCVTTSLSTTIRTTRSIPVSISGTVHFSFCFTNAVACEQFEGDTEGFNREGGSTDPGFPREPAQPVGETLTPEGSTGGPCSFTTDTAVTTDHGQQAIGTLQVGERVLAYNPKTGKLEQEPILHVWINHDHDLVDLTLTTTTTKGEHGKPATKTSEAIHTNQKHPFFTLEHGFLPVGQIKLGMHLLRADGRVGVVTGWKVVPGTKTMYNLEVAQDHTFTVGTGQWVVHNTCDPDNPPSGFPGQNGDAVGTPTGFADAPKLNRHFRDHGLDFGATTPQIYEQQAIDFLSGAPDSYELQVRRPGGDYARWNMVTGEFGVVTPSGVIRTYYDISGKVDALAYFLGQYR